MIRFHRQFGFTLIEALLSSLILAVGAVIIGGLMQRTLQNNLRGWEYEQGYRLVDECLDNVVGQGLARIGYGSTEGDFGDRYPNYRYEINIEPAEQTDLYRVTATVLWEIGAQNYEVSASTLLYDLQEL